MGTYTPNKHLYKPAVNEVGWGTLVDANWDVLDNVVSSVFSRTGDVVAGANDYAAVDNLLLADTHNESIQLDSAGRNIAIEAQNAVSLQSASGPFIFVGTAGGDQQIQISTGTSTIQTDLLGANLSITSNKVNMSASGEVDVPTPATGDNSTKAASTAFVKAQGYATLASPALTGVPTAPTATGGTNTTQIATTAFVQSAMGTLSAIATSGKWSDLQNATAALTLANGTNNTTFNHTSATTWTWANTTAASSGTSQSSPILTLSGSYWTGSLPATDSWTIQDVIANGTNGASILTFAHSGSAGTAAVQFPAASGTTFGGCGVQLGANFALGGATNVLYAISNSSTTVELRLYTSTGGSLLQMGFGANSAPASACSMTATQGLYLRSGVTTGLVGVQIGNSQSSVATSGTQVGVSCGDGTAAANTNAGLTFGPSSGTANFIAFRVAPVINQTSTSSGSYTGLLVNVVETSLKGTANKLLTLQAGASGGTTKFEINNSGVVDNYNGEATAGVGTSYLRGSTLQKAETGADANVLTVTPASATGLYRITVVFSVSAASSATLGWTATWTDGNAHAQAPTNLALNKVGVPAPALTFAAAVNDTYAAEWDIDVDASGTAIVIKTTFAGTSIAYKASATIERIA